MFATLLRRAREPLSKVTGAGAGPTAPSSASNPFKARKVWPPNLEELTPQQQLRFEKKYKRRVVLAQRAPGWQKGVKYAQFATLTAAMAYLIFYAEFEWYGRKYVPLDEIRHSFNTIFGVFDADKRHERPRTAPPAPEPNKDDK
ncbi:hypothetical protein NLU13_3358 [Sarocladium strictum]|uniref:Uncharacterized protein n=1 Tax=Sarocladium strictum TaxID=5046 RepID=A0AA39GLV7_SARSR|nr:hypothetical protein NLU13_3358 [Sarocladium strictum]